MDTGRIKMENYHGVLYCNAWQQCALKYTRTIIPMQMLF